MNDLIKFCQDHWDHILLVLMAAHLLARRIVDLTPSPADNKIMDAIDSALQLIGTNKRE